MTVKAHDETGGVSKTWTGPAMTENEHRETGPGLHGPEMTGSGHLETGHGPVMTEHDHHETGPGLHGPVHGPRTVNETDEHGHGTRRNSSTVTETETVLDAPFQTGRKRSVENQHGSVEMMSSMMKSGSQRPAPPHRAHQLEQEHPRAEQCPHCPQLPP